MLYSFRVEAPRLIVTPYLLPRRCFNPLDKPSRHPITVFGRVLKSSL